MIKICVNCEDEFDTNSPAKKACGGLLAHCPECSQEIVVKYAGIQAADGKQTQATILKFNSDSDKKRYLAFWHNNMGMSKGKSCTLGRHLSTDPGIRFETVVAHIATNHKGKA